MQSAALRTRAIHVPEHSHTTPQNAPAVSVYLTFFGVVLGFLSTFWSWSYTRLSRKLFFYLSSPALDGTKQVCWCCLRVVCWRDNPCAQLCQTSYNVCVFLSFRTLVTGQAQ